MQAVSPPPLEKLALNLRQIFRTKQSTQQQMSAALNIAQSTISKAKQGKLKRETDDTRAIQNYANILLGDEKLPEAVQKAAVGFLSAGGSEVELVEAIMLTTRLIRGRRDA